MDEPLSNLDAALRVQTRAEILKLQKRLGDDDDLRDARPGGGDDDGRPDRRHAQGRPAADRHARGAVHAAREHLRRDVHRLACDEPRPGPPLGLGPETVLAGFRPEHIRLGSPARARSAFEAAVEVVEYLGDERLAHLRLGDHTLVAKLPVEQRIAAGARTTFSVAHESVVFFDAESGKAIAAV